jgi:hypothetical protein
VKAKLIRARNHEIDEAKHGVVDMIGRHEVVLLDRGGTDAALRVKLAVLDVDSDTLASVGWVQLGEGSRDAFAAIAGYQQSLDAKRVRHAVDRAISQVLAGVYFSDDIEPLEHALGVGREPGPRRWGIADLEPLNSPTGYYGSPGTLKTLVFSVLRSICYVTKTPFLGCEVESPGAAVIFDWELDKKEIERQLWQISRGLGLKEPPVGIFYERMDAPFLDSLDRMHKLVDSISRRERTVTAMTIDSLTFAGVTNEERAIQAYAALRDFAEQDIAVSCIDHQARSQKGETYGAKLPYGSMLKEAGFRSLWQVEAAERQPGVNLTEIVIRDQKGSFRAKSPEIGIRATFKTRSITIEDVDPQGVETMAALLNQPDRVLAALRRIAGLGDATTKAVADAAGLTVPQVKPVLSRLAKRGEVVKRDSGKGKPARWRPTLSRQVIDFATVRRQRKASDE